MEEIELPKINNFHATYVYNNKLKDWEFKGYNCIKCEKTIKSLAKIEKHINNCKRRNPKVYKVDPTPVYIRDLNGLPWKPLEINQVPDLDVSTYQTAPEIEE